MYDAANLSAAEIFSKVSASQARIFGGHVQMIEEQRVGGVLWTISTVTSGGNIRVTRRGGDFTDSSGYFNKQSWKQDENGVVTLLGEGGSIDIQSALADQFDVPDINDATVLGVTQSTPREYAIEVKHPGGSDQFYYYDAQTFTLDRIERYTADRYRHVEEFSDYRTAYGGHLAYAVHAYDGRPQNDLTDRIVALQDAPANADVSIPPSTGVYGFSAAAPVVLPSHFVVDRGNVQQVVVQATIAGRRLDFLLDSGSAEITLDPDVARSLGLVPYGRRSITVGGGDVDMGFVRVPHMSMGSLNMDRDVLTTTPFGEDPDPKTHVVGLMGFPFFASGVLGIDFKRQTVTVYPPGTFDPKSLGLTALPVSLADDTPRMPVTIDGITGLFALDTGSQHLLLHSRYTKRLPSAHIKSNREEIETVGGPMQANYIDVNDLIFAGTEFRRLTAYQTQMSTLDFGDDGLIGLDLLSHYLVYFDYANGAVFVKPTFL